jgi:hypothetical protein
VFFYIQEQPIQMVFLQIKKPVWQLSQGHLKLIRCPVTLHLFPRHLTNENHSYSGWD